MLSLVEKVNACGESLKDWDKEVTGNVSSKINTVKSKIEILQQTRSFICHSLETLTQ